MPYSISSYQNAGGSPFQQYQNQQQQNQLQQQQAQNQSQYLQYLQGQQGQQGQQNPTQQGFGGQQGGFGGQQGFQYNPLPTYNVGQQQPPTNQGNPLQRGIGTRIETPQNTQLMGPYQPPNNTTSQTNPYATSQQLQPQQYYPFQSYGMFGSPSGGTGTYDFSNMFNYQ